MVYSIPFLLDFVLINMQPSYSVINFWYDFNRTTFNFLCFSRIVHWRIWFVLMLSSNMLFNQIDENIELKEMKQSLLASLSLSLSEVSKVVCDLIKNHISWLCTVVQYWSIWPCLRVGTRQTNKATMVNSYSCRFWSCCWLWGRFVVRGTVGGHRRLFHC